MTSFINILVVSLWKELLCILPRIQELVFPSKWYVIKEEHKSMTNMYFFASHGQQKKNEMELNIVSQTCPNGLGQKVTKDGLKTPV